MHRLHVPRHRVTCAFFFLVLAAAASVSPAVLGQEIEWRTDYGTARREAVEKNRSLVIDLGTENCFWCKRLDATTFRDPAIILLMNEQFIPLRLDAERDPFSLAEKLGVHSYPTIVFANPEGKLIGTIGGYQEAAPFLDNLQRVLAATSTPEWMGRDLQTAQQALSTMEYARALTLLKNIVNDGRERPVQVKARQMLQEMEQQAAVRLALAKQQVDKGQKNEAVGTTSEVIRIFAGTQAAVEASRMLSSLNRTMPSESPNTLRSQRGHELLLQAKDEMRAGQYHACLGHAEYLAANFADQAEGSEGQLLANEIKNNPEWLRLACDALSDQLGVLYLSLADTWIKKGQPQQAAIYLERVIQAVPGSRQAEIAQVRLSQIQGQPSRLADPKVP